MNILEHIIWDLENNPDKWIYSDSNPVHTIRRTEWKHPVKIEKPFLKFSFQMELEITSQYRIKLNRKQKKTINRFFKQAVKVYNYNESNKKLKEAEKLLQENLTVKDVARRKVQNSDRDG